MKRIKKHLAVLITSLLAVVSMWMSDSAMAQTLALTDVTIETMGEQGRLEGATLVLKDGKIETVGTDVDIPDDARVSSLSGKTIIPGLIDPYFVFKRSSGGQSRTVTFNGRTFTIPGSTRFTVGSFTRIGKYFDPYKFDFRPALRTGIVTANLVSDGRGLSALGNISAEPDPGMLFQPEGQLFAKVTNQTTALDIIRKPLKPSGSSQSKTTVRRTSTSSSSSSDDAKERWDAVRKGEAPVFVNLNNSAAVAHVLMIAEKAEKAKIVLIATGPNLYPSLDEIKKNQNLTVVLQPGIDTVPFTQDLMNVARLLEEKKIPFAISMSLSSSQMNANQDDPLFPLAMLVKTGLDRETALRSVTIEPAQILGIEKSRGSIEKGKQADLLVFDGEPLQSGSRLLAVYSNGKVIHEQ
jgi:hypothetical protein